MRGILGGSRNMPSAVQSPQVPRTCPVPPHGDWAFSGSFVISAAVATVSQGPLTLGATLAHTGPAAR